MDQISTTTSPPQETPFSALPIDFILKEILPKLPAKTLLRFKTVCKAFNNLISSPHFISLHHRHSLSSSANPIIIIPSYRRILAYDLSTSPPSRAAFAWGKSSSISVVGSVNGHILLGSVISYTESIYLLLLNPTTRTYLPIGYDAVKFEAVLDGGVNLGLGFDHISDDFKIVAVSDRRNGVSTPTRTTMVYSVKTKIWRIVHTLTQPSDSIELQNDGVLINNRVLHWRFWDASMRKRRMGCFDVCNETWIKDVLLPEFYYDPCKTNFLLDFGVFDGCLSSSFENGDDRSYDVWVMKEYGVQESWMKLLSVPVSDGLYGGVVPVACQSDGCWTEVLVEQRHEMRLFWYNRIENKIREADEFIGPSLKTRNGEVYVCKGSLVDLPDSKFLGKEMDVFSSLLFG